MWKSKLQKNYTNFDDFCQWDEIYNLAKRLGFKSAKEAWDKNPMIQGSTDPKDFKCVRKRKKCNTKTGFDV